MTQAEFTEKFKALLNEKNISTKFSSIALTKEPFERMLFYNAQKDEFCEDYVVSIGFDCGDLFLDFYETDCRAYDIDLENNSQTAWEYLWEYIKSLDIRG